MRVCLKASDSNVQPCVTIGRLAERCALLKRMNNHESKALSAVPREGIHACASNCSASGALPLIIAPHLRFPVEPHALIVRRTCRSIYTLTSGTSASFNWTLFPDHLRAVP
eukprot:384688-Pelagomonas_calceolata.AAC.7